MELMVLALGALYAFMFLFVIADFAYFLVGDSLGAGRLLLVRYVVMLFTNIATVFFDLEGKNECCGGGWSWFAPAHRLSIYLVMALGMGAYFYCAHRRKLASPVIEVIVNCLLLTDIGFYVLTAIQVNDGWWMWIVCPLPAVLLCVMQLAHNHQLAIKELMARDEEGAPVPESRVVQFCWFLLQQKALMKFPVLLMLCLPLLICVVAVLLLFGQKPDSLVRAFTETYKQGLSQLDIDCNKVACPGGHFLCTIAAKGHPGLVRPVRTGVRAGDPIKCNRQLLISNAFEEWLEQHAPWIHGPVRKAYNRVGAYLHRHYGVFDRKWVSDIVYISMKPLEWIFLLVLYIGDRHPENRIAQQYMHRADREIIKAKYHCE